MLDVVFTKGRSRRYRSVLHRADGVEVELEGGSYNKIGVPAREIPHDIAHLVVEDELGIERGVWGVLAAGGLFRGASVIGGRRRPHAATRARALLDESVEQLNQAEILTRAVCDQSLRGGADLRALRAATGPRYWLPSATEEGVAAAIRRLGEAGARWRELPPGGTLDFSWPRSRSPSRRSSGG